MSRTRTLLLLALAFSTLADTALAVTTEECLAAADEGQKQLTSKKLVAARKSFVACAQDACPGPVKKDCTGWLGQVDASLPSIVPVARDAAGNDVPDVRLAIDGQDVPNKPGVAIEVDPGEHVIRFTPRTGPPVELRVVVREGERNRPVQASVGGAPPIASSAPPPSTTAAPSATATTTLPPRDTSKPIPVVAYALAGVGVVGLGVFTYLGLSGRSDVQHLRDTCAPACPKSDEDAARKKLLFADVGLGVGLVSLGVATYLVVSSRGSTRTTVGFAPGPRGGAAVLGGSFQ